jgi:hypothetical protein
MTGAGNKKRKLQFFWFGLLCDEFDFIGHNVKL